MFKLLKIKGQFTLAVSNSQILKHMLFFVDFIIFQRKNKYR